MAITVSAEDYVDDLFHDPGEESELRQGFVRGDAKLMLSSGDGHDSIADVLATFPQPMFHIHQRHTAGEG